MRDTNRTAEPLWVILFILLAILLGVILSASPASGMCELPPCEIARPPVYYTELASEPDWCVYSAGDVVMLLIDGSPFVPVRATRWFVVPRTDPDAGFYQGVYSNMGWCTNFYVQEGCYVEAGPW
jgi:hypothetical protein